jgi:hypothetical protein
MNRRKALFTLFTIFSVIGYGVFVFAAGPITYAPGETLNPGPGCLPDGNCFVDLSEAGVSIGSPIVTGTAGQVLYTDASGNIFGDDFFIRDSSSNNTTIGKNFGGDVNGGFELGDNLFGLGASGGIISYTDSSVQQTSFLGTGDFTVLGVPADHGSMVGDINFVSGDLSQISTTSSLLTGLLLKDSVFNPAASTYESAINLTPTYLNIDYKFGIGTPNHYLVGLNNTGVIIGDPEGTIHGTYIQVNDTNKGINNFTDGSFNVSNADNSADFFVVDTVNGNYRLGDLGTTLHGTMFAINDTDRAITFNFGGDFYSFPTGDGSSGQVMQTDGNGQLSWASVAGSPFEIDGNGNLYDSAQSAGANLSSGSNNFFAGPSAGYSTDSGYQNTFIGYQAGYSNQSGYNNFFQGYRAGYTNTTGTDNIAIGTYADVLSSGVTNAIALGAGAVAASNQFALPDSVTGARWGGADYTFPVSQASGVLTNNGSGTLSWSVVNGFSINGNGSMFAGTDAGSSLTSGSGNFFAGISAGKNTVDGYSNTFVGNSAGYSNISGVNNTFFGMGSGYSNISGNSNVFMGEYAGAYYTAPYNSVFIGAGAGSVGSGTGGGDNVFIGINTGLYNSSGNWNTFIGTSAGENWEASTSQVAIGHNALRGSVVSVNNTGANNTAIGYQTGYANTSGNSNLFVGYIAGLANTEGDGNVFLGPAAGNANTTGDENIFIGDIAGTNNITGSNNVIIGLAANVASSSTSNAIALGQNAIAGNNQFVVGDGSAGIEEMLIKGATESCTIRPDTAGIACTSDERLKTNIVDLDNVLDSLQQIRTVEYDWLSKPGEGRHIGFLAQNLQEHLPELVSNGPYGYLQVNYAGITPVLVRGINELNLKITNIENFATAENKTFLNNLIAWFADATNGIGRLFAGEVHTDTLCVGETCVTETQLQQLLNAQGVSAGFGYGYGGN